MTALAYTVRDSATMLRRNLRRLLRYPSMTLLLVGMPIMFMLLFVYVFGGQLGHGLGGELAGGHAGRDGYLDYVTPGILLMTVAAAVQGTAIVGRDGHDRRHRRPVPHHADRPRRVLTGHVLASLDPDAGQHRRRSRRRGRARLPTHRRPARLARRHRRAGAVRVRAHLARDRARPRREERRDSEQHPDVPRPAAVPRQRLRAHRHPCRPGSGRFASYQPFTPVTETLRGLLAGTPIGTNALAAIAWSLGIALASSLWATHLYAHRRPH